MSGTLHVVGAGLAGLAAALGAGSRQVLLHEAAPQAGGRCRSYHDPVLGREIDNGNHLVLSGNRDVAAFLQETGGATAIDTAPRAGFDFIDLAQQDLRWRLDLGIGRMPWWLFDRQRRVAGTGIADYLACLPLMREPSASLSVGEVLRTDTVLYRRLLQPLLIAALNTPAEYGSARLAAAIVRETLGAGGQACRPMVARHGLSAAFIAPALDTLRARGARFAFGHRLRQLVLRPDGCALAALAFDDTTIALGAEDAVILAVPSWVATALLPGLIAPEENQAIVNLHYDMTPPPGCPALVGVVGGLSEWVFAYPDRLSVTISAADRLLDTPRETLAARCWPEVARTVGLPATTPMPRWQVVREKRATFAATPQQDARRPGPLTALDNLFLAGDWTATGLPATIEGAIRSGRRAAAAVPPAHSGGARSAPSHALSAQAE